MNPTVCLLEVGEDAVAAAAWVWARWWAFSVAGHLRRSGGVGGGTHQLPLALPAASGGGQDLEKMLLPPLPGLRQGGGHSLYLIILDEVVGLVVGLTNLGLLLAELVTTLYLVIEDYL
nr:hypothetical protein CFP56_68288 [Quercus suber]